MTKKRSSSEKDSPSKITSKRSKLEESGQEMTGNWEKCLKRAKDLNLFIGVHVSGADGIYNSIKNAKSVGATSFALFIKNQRSFNSKPLDPKDINKFKEMVKESGIDPNNHIIPHGSYLTNLARNDLEKREKSYNNFLDELKRCELLGIKNFNIHPGSVVEKDCPIETGIKNIADCINQAIKETEFVRILLENSAGQGQSLGVTFQELKDMIDLIEDKDRIGVCLDTCHLFAAGYDLNQDIIKEFTNFIDIKYLKCIHVNDSKTDLGSKKDRHENIGKGKIGKETLRKFVQDKRLRGIPMILETPVDWKLFQSPKIEIDLLYEGAEKTK